MNSSPVDEVDVIVVGSGVAGFTAAVTAAHGGAEVLLVEKADVFGGTTAISGGALWIPESSHAKTAGLDDSREKVLTYLDALMGGVNQRDMLEAFLDAAPEAIDFLEQNTRAKFTVRKVAPDYHSDLEGTVPAGRTMDAGHFDGRLLGRDFKRLRSPLPQFMALGKMMVTLDDIVASAMFKHSWDAKKHILKMGLRYLVDRLQYPRGTRLVYGNALIAALMKTAIDQDVCLWPEAAATGLIKQEGRITGLKIERDGKAIQVMARHGVVLAAGGAPHSEQWRQDNLRSPDNHVSMAPKSNTGDGISMAIEAGARLADGNAEASFFAPVSVHTRKNGEKVLYPHLMGDRIKPGAIAVDHSGMRFVNESLSYHEFVRGMMRASNESPVPAANLIGDAKFLRKYGMGLARFGNNTHEGLIEDGYLIKADSISELAEKIGVPAEALSETVRKANQYAESGVDPEFGKGSTAYSRYLGDARKKPNPCLGPIKTVPFYAVKLFPGDIGTARGLRTDEKARVLGADGQPIPGLYACGNDMNSVMSGHYPGGGITIGPGLTFGYLAAQDILSNLEVSK